ncbi:NAS-14 protein [Aphelenchoides avenae]|nr:NAS-14 protein [Aphelenchus avenae]
MDAMHNSQLFEGDIMGVPLDADRSLLYGSGMGEIRRTFRRSRRQRQNGGAFSPSRNPFEDIFSRPFYSSLNILTYPDKLWDGGRVPYLLEEGMTLSQRAAIAQAFDEYKQKTCVRFVPREESDYDYIYIKRNQAFGCSSYVGRAGGNQTVSLEVGKCFTKGIIAHELMHSIGFFHEHSRTDRDDYVRIEEDHIRPGMMRNFEKYPRKIIDPLGMPYDYGSVMHYHKLAFSKNGKPTIVPRDEKAEIGQRYKLSEIDAKKINLLYQCDEPTTTSATQEPPATTQKATTKMSTTSAPATTSTTPSTSRTTSDRWPVRKLTKLGTWPTVRAVWKTTTPAPPMEKTKIVIETRIEKCIDLNAHCEMWEKLGHCQHSAKYMAHYCRKSCKLCRTEIEVSRPLSTPPPSATTTTTSNPDEESQGLIDKNLFCGYWAKIGECKSESKFMKLYCRKSCAQYA